MSVRHTPGPWRIGAGPTTGKPCIEAADGTWICGQIINQSNMESEGAANARLIAASPTMANYIQRKADEGDEEAQRIMEAIHAPS